MAKVIVSTLYQETMLGATCEGEVNFIATDKKERVLGTKRLRGILRGTPYSFDVGGKLADKITCVMANERTICEWKRA